MVVRNMEEKEEKKTTTKEEALLKDVRDRLKIAMDAESDNRALSLEDARFENGEQWTDADKEEREREGRPCLTINKTAGTVKLVVGENRQNNTGIKVRPVDGEQDIQIAEVMTGMIRNIENVSDAETAYDNGFECAVRGGIGYWRITTDYAGDDTFDQDIKIERVVNPQSVYYDSSVVKQDKTDAGWCIITETMDLKKYKETYPKSTATSSIDEGEGEGDSDWFAEEAIRVAEYFVVEKKSVQVFLLTDGRSVTDERLSDEDVQALRDGGLIEKERTAKVNSIVWYKVNGNEILEGPKQWAGRFIPVIPVMGEEVWIDGKQILRSAIRFMKEPAKLYNWARSNAAETLALSPKQPYLLTPDEIKGHEASWNIAHRKPMPYLLHNASQLGRPQRQPASMADSGAMNEAMMAADDIKSTGGYHDASLGAQSNETSGKAINARKTQSNTATFVFFDNLTRAKKHTGKVLVDLIPRIYDTERVVRLLNKDGSEAWATINKQTPDGKETDLSVGKYDVVIDIGASYATKRTEATDGMVQLVQAAPQYAPIIIPEIAKNSDWPGADDIADQMAQMNQPQQQGPDPEQQAAMQKGQLELQKGQIELKRGELDLTKANIELEGKKLDNQKKTLEIQGQAAQNRDTGQ